MKCMKIKYTEANLKQFTKARDEFAKSNKLEVLPEKFYSNNLKADKFERYPSYDKNGELTLVGKAKRLTDLERYGLNTDTTLEEFFTFTAKELQKKLIQIVDDINKRLH